MKIFLPIDKDPKDHPSYEKILEAMKEGKLKVNCPWWSKNHWEDKTTGDLFDGCNYLILE